MADNAATASGQPAHLPEKIKKPAIRDYRASHLAHRLTRRLATPTHVKAGNRDCIK